MARPPVATDRAEKATADQIADDAALRLKIAHQAYQARRAALAAAFDELRTIKLVAQHLASEMNTRLAQLDARVGVLSRTVAGLLAELDQSHTTTVTRIQRAIPGPSSGAPGPGAASVEELGRALPPVDDIDPLAATQRVRPEASDARPAT